MNRRSGVVEARRLAADSMPGVGDHDHVGDAVPVLELAG